MTWVIASKLLNKRIRSRDNVLVGTVEQLEIDVATWQVKALKVEASRDLMDKLGLAQPNVTGGRLVYIDTMDVDRVDEDAIHLRVDALGLAKLRWHHASLLP